VEIDGFSHEVGDRPRRDARRDARLDARHVTVFHICASDLIRGVDETADAVLRMAAEKR
jgi:very-short-patch-repair endonuclease